MFPFAPAGRVGEPRDGDLGFSGTGVPHFTGPLRDHTASPALEFYATCARSIQGYSAQLHSEAAAFLPWARNYHKGSDRWDFTYDDCFSRVLWHTLN